MWDSGLHPCFTVSHPSGCIFPTRTTEGRRRRKPVQGGQPSPGTSPGCWVFQQEPSLLQPRQAPPPWPSRGPRWGRRAPAKPLSRRLGEGKGGTLGLAPKDDSYRPVRARQHCPRRPLLPCQLFAARDIGRQSWRACEGLRRRNLWRLSSTCWVRKP